MDSDDKPVGRVLNRRNALALLGLAGVASATVGGTAVAASGATSGPGAARIDCVAKPEMVEGPYFVDERLNRSDIRIDSADGSMVAGIPLILDLCVAKITQGCGPLPGATVDIWHCDAAGRYSGFAAEGTAGHNFLRGYQVTNSRGAARFTTVLPGWYRGRTVHVHIKIQTIGTDGHPYEFTSQLYFTEEFKSRFLALEPYAAKGAPDTVNSTDMFYGEGGDQMLLRPTRARRGYAATFGVGLDLSDATVGDDDSFPPGGPGGPLPTSPSTAA